jgi:hypothetical protein
VPGRLLGEVRSIDQISVVSCDLVLLVVDVGLVPPRAIKEGNVDSCGWCCFKTIGIDASVYVLA